MSAIDVFLNNTNIDEYIQSCEIVFDESNPCNSFSINLSDDFFLTTIAGDFFNSTTNYIPSSTQISIYTGTGSTADVLQGNFYIEDVSRTINKLGNPSNTISGRNELAKLDQPFAGKLQFDIYNLWGEYNMLASDIITNLAALYGLEVYSFDIDDFTINYLWTFEDYPLDIISRIVKTTNGYVRSTRDGKIWIKKNTFHDWGAPDETFTSINIIKEEYILPELVNRVKYVSPTTSYDANIHVSLSADKSSLYENDDPDTDGDDRVATLTAVITDNDGNGVADGTQVNWELESVDPQEDSYPLGNLAATVTETDTIAITNEQQTASDRKHVSTQYPISSVTSVTSIDGNTSYAVASFEGRKITLSDSLPFSNSIVLINYKACGIATNTLTISGSNMTLLDVEDGSERYLHAFVDHIRDTITMTFNYGKYDPGYNVSLSTSSSTIEGTGSIECEVVATKSNGDPVDDGTIVDWTIDDAYGDFLHSQTTIGTKLISNEEKTSRDIRTVNTDYPISAVSSVTLRGGGTDYYSGGSFDGRTITLGSVLPYNDTVVWITYTAGGISSNTLTGNNSVTIEQETDAHATVLGIRDTQTISFKPASAVENVKIRLKTTGSVIEGTGTIDYEVIVTNIDGSAVDNGTSVQWTIDDSTYGSFRNSTTTTTTKSITDEEVVASSRHTVTVDYPISSVSSVKLRGGSGEYYTAGSSFDGNTITLASPLPYNDSVVWVTYVGQGISENTLEGSGAVIEGEVEVDTHVLSNGVRATATITFRESDAADHVSVDLSADPTSLDADGSTTSALEAVVTNEDNDPVANGTEVVWTIDDNYASFANSTTTTGTKSIVDEQQTASNNITVSTDYPIVSVTSVVVNGTNYYTSGSSFSGNTITLATPLPYNDSIVLITYTAGGVATNTLTAGTTYPVETYIHAYSLGIRDSVLITLNEPDVGTTSDRIVKIIVKDRVTGSVISGASVTVDGVNKGTTDSNGQINLGILSAGDHTISVTKSGYRDSDADGLQNDVFTVS
jgi:hypothetical protein